MFEARMKSASLLKQLVDAMKDLVSETKIQCSVNGMDMQAMDTSHVSLVVLSLASEGFEQFRCDKNLSMGLSLVNLSKVLKCAGSDDALTIRAQDESDVATFMFENLAMDKLADFEFKLMNIQSEDLTIPDSKYEVTVRLPSKEFRTIISDLSQLGDTCVISVSKEGVSFSVSGDLGTGNITVRQKTAIDDDAKGSCSIEMVQPIKLTFSLRQIVHFTKATPLSERVTLFLSPEMPLIVEYKMEGVGCIKYYLAPKMDEEGA